MAVILMRRHFLAIPADDLYGVGVKRPAHGIRKKADSPPAPVLQNAPGLVLRVGKAVDPEHAVIKKWVPEPSALDIPAALVRGCDALALVRPGELRDLINAHASPRSSIGSFSRILIT